MQAHQYPHHFPAALLRRNSADTPAAGLSGTGRGVVTVAGDGGCGGSHSWGASAPQQPHSGSGSSLMLNTALLGRVGQQQPQQQQQPQSGGSNAVAAGQHAGSTSSSAAAAAAALPSARASVSDSVPVRGISRGHSGSSRAGQGVKWDPEIQGGDGGTAGGGCSEGGGTTGFGSVVEVEDGLKEPLLGEHDGDSGSDTDD
jgi:hypothetical protein